MEVELLAVKKDVLWLARLWLRLRLSKPLKMLPLLAICSDCASLDN